MKTYIKYQNGEIIERDFNQAFISESNFAAQFGATVSSKVEFDALVLAKEQAATAKAQAKAVHKFIFPLNFLSQTLGGTQYDGNLDALVSEAVKLGANVSTDPTTGDVVVLLFVSFYNQLPAAAKDLVDPYKL